MTKVMVFLLSSVNIYCYDVDMNVSVARLEELIQTFPKLLPILEKLDRARIPYALGGSATLYVQGHARKPRDVDVMFDDDDFVRANKLFKLTPEHIERPYNNMNKSKPTDDGSVDFLNRYTAKFDGRLYCGLPDVETVVARVNTLDVPVLVAEKIALFKLLTRRDHHDDVSDFMNLFKHPTFDTKIFWQIADTLGVRGVVEGLLEGYDGVIPKYIQLSKP